ncbi:MAG: hypothetical protein ACSHXD_20270 [Marinosulfonomonas sp.]
MTTITVSKEAIDELLTEALDIQGQVDRNDGLVAIPGGSGLGITPDREFIRHCDIGNDKI